MDSIHLVAPLLGSVGRIAGRGSCVVLSMTPNTSDASKARAILLTTSHVISRRVDAHGLEAVFFENPMQGSSARQGIPKQPVVVLLRPEQVFLTSAEDPKQKQAAAAASKTGSNLIQSAQQQGGAGGAGGDGAVATTQQPQQQAGAAGSDSIGYSIVACDVEGRYAESATNARGTSEYGSSYVASESTGSLSKYRPIYQRDVTNDQLQAEAMAARKLSGISSSGASSTLSGSYQMSSAHMQSNLPPPSIAACICPGLPLVTSRCPKVHKGDVHLVITHASGGPQRNIYTLTVGESYDNYCVYNEIDTTVMFSSGGIVFSKEGDFVGIQHQSPGPDCSHYCMFIKEITHHLFLSHSLSLVQVPILDGNLEDVAGVVGAVAKSVLDRDLYVTGVDPLWKRQHHALNRGNQVDQDTQSCLTMQGGVLTDEARAVHVRNKARYGGNYSQLMDYKELQREQALRTRYVPPTLMLFDHFEVFDSFYDPNDYSSLVHMVGCFGYHPELSKKILNKLVAHEHRNHLAQFAENQGMPPLIELLERNSGNADITQTGVTALARLTQYEMNREAMNRYNGLQTLLSLLHGWRNHVHVVEWGCFALMNMTAPETLRAKENAKVVADHGGIVSLCGFVKELGLKGTKSGHIRRWALHAVSNCIGRDKGMFDMALDAGICSIVFDCLVEFSDSYSLFGSARCILTLVAVELFDAAVDYFVHAGVLSILVSLLQGIALAGSSSSITAAGGGRGERVGGGGIGGAGGAGGVSSASGGGGAGGGVSPLGLHSPSGHQQQQQYTSSGSASDALTTHNLLTALRHIVEQRPKVIPELVNLNAVEVVSACAKVFAKEGELVNVAASLISMMSA